MNKLNGKITKSATMRGAMTRGAGGGTYVEANPEGEATDTLEKLMVESDKYEFINGFGFVDLSICPHFELNNDRAMELKIDLENSSKKVYSLENCCALKIVDNKYEVIRSVDNRNLYLCYYDGDSYKEDVINKDF